MFQCKFQIIKDYICAFVGVCYLSKFTTQVKALISHAHYMIRLFLLFLAKPNLVELNTSVSGTVRQSLCLLEFSLNFLLSLFLSFFPLSIVLNYRLLSSQLLFHTIVLHMTIHIYKAPKEEIHTPTSNRLSVGKRKEPYFHVKYKKISRFAETLCRAEYNQPFKCTKYWFCTIYIHTPL